MRVGIFSESYKPIINGVSTSMDTLVAELERAGHTVYVFTSRFPRYEDDRTGVFRYPSVNSVIEPDYVLPIPISHRIASAIPKLKLDIVHSQSPFALGWLARRVARQAAIPLVSTNHTIYTEYTHYFPFASKSFARATLIRWMSWYYNECDWVFAPSAFTRSLLVDGFHIRTPVTVVPTGIPEPPYILASDRATKESLQIPADARILLYVGRLAREKNLDLLLDAFAGVRSQCGNVFLVVAGSGNNADRMKERTKALRLTNYVRYTGFLDRTRLDPLYRAADVFVYPSITETQGLAVGEALAAGTPCVVVNGGGAPETVTDGVDGIVVPNDADRFSLAVQRLLQDNDLRRRFSEAGRRNIERLRPERVAQIVIDRYERLVAGDRTQTEATAMNDDCSSAP